MGVSITIMRKFWIAVPHSATSPTKENAHLLRILRNTPDVLNHFKAPFLRHHSPDNLTIKD